MRFITYEEESVCHVGLLVQQDSEIVPLVKAEKILLGTSLIPDNMLDIISGEDKFIPVIKKIMDKFAVSLCPKIKADTAKILAPIPRPTKNIFCVGLNYREHVEEAEVALKNSNIPQHPVLFSKAPTTVTGPDSMVKSYAGIVTDLDYEVELAVIIGKAGTGIKKADAYDHIFGYTIINDVSARDLQFRHVQWLLGKSCDTFAPMGPCLVYKSEFANPQMVDITCKINGEMRQNNNTKNMIFDIPTIIETISSVLTLEPGDIIATGTPSGVGLGFNPPKYLKPGDVMELEIPGIGILKNTIE